MELTNKRMILALAALSIAGAPAARSQGRPVDWPSAGGDARRSGWERSDTRITKDNVKDFQLVLKRKLEASPGAQQTLTPPVVIGLLISYKGFKELGFVSSNLGHVWSIDLDVDKMFWDKALPAAKVDRGSGACMGVTASPTLTPPATFNRNRAAARPAAPQSPSPGQPPTPAGRNTTVPARLGGGGFGGARPMFVVTSDGMLHQLNTSDGSDQFPPLHFLPANAHASDLAMHDNVIYTATSGNCGGAPNAIWALDLSSEDPEPKAFKLDGNVAGLHGFAVGNDGTVYAQTEATDGALKLVALSAKTLEPKGSFTVEGSPSKDKMGLNRATPVVFDMKGKDVIVAGTPDGRLALLNSEGLDSGNTKTPLSQTEPLSANGGGLWGGISTWEDADGVRWVAAPVWGAVNPGLKQLAAGSAPTNGAIVAFRVDDQDGKLSLKPGWVSRDLHSPVPPVVTSGVVFALSTGSAGQKAAGKATLYALDGQSGKELYSTGSQVTAPANLTGMTVANGRVFFTTRDNMLYGFGVFLER